MLLRILKSITRRNESITSIVSYPEDAEYLVHPSSFCDEKKVILSRGSTFSVGAGSKINCAVHFEREGVSVAIGERVFIGGGSKLISAEKLSIGSDVLISWGVTLVDHNSHSISFSERKQDLAEWIEGRKDWTHVPRAPIIIEDKVWIGFEAKILKGVRIGEGAVVGAASVVTKDVLPWTIVAGNPARVIREIPEEER